MNPFKKLKLKSKLRNCDYKLAGTVIKQQYYNDNSYTEINRMIDHFMEEPCFERALDLIEYNEMIVFYFTESCTDGLYVRKAESGKATESTESSELSEFAEFSDLPDLPNSPDLPVVTSTETASLFPTPPSSRLTNHTVFEEKSVENPHKETPRKENPAHSEHLQTIQESEQWMDQMISRLAKKPKLPAISNPAPSGVKEFARPSMPPAAKVYNDEEAEAFDTIEFTTADGIQDIEVFEDALRAKPTKEKEVWYEAEVVREPAITEETKVAREPYVFEEPAVIQEPVVAREPYVFEEPAAIQEPVVAREPYVFHEPAAIQEPVVAREPYVFQEPAVIHEPNSTPEPNVFQEPASSHKSDAFDFVASAASNKHFGVENPADLFATPPTKAPYIEPPRVKRPRFPNVAATLKIDLHTMMKQLDEYRYELAYHPSNEQQLIHWIESLEKAIDEFSNAIDIIEDAYE